MTTDSPTFADACRYVIAHLEDAQRRLSAPMRDEPSRTQDMGRRLALNNITCAKDTLAVALDAERHVVRG